MRPMGPHYSPEDHLTALTQTWVGSILIMGAVLFPVLGFMDYFVSPDHFTLFMTYRLAVAALLAGLYFLNKLKRSKPYQYVIAAVGAALSAITVELAVLQSGGQNSTYYAAMMVLTICCLGFAPMGMPLSFVLVGIVYVIYAVPIMLTENITSGVFVSNNAFLISMFVIGLLLRYNNQKLLVSELQLRAELSEDKHSLQMYSDSLQDQVAAKSGALAISELKYRALFDNANDGIAVLDKAGNVTDVNRRFCELHGFEREQVLGTDFRLLEIENRGGELDERLKKILAGGSLVYEAEHYRKDGSRIFLEISSRAIDIGGAPHIQAFCRDITEKMKLQEQVLQSQKMESMGALAGGIAHDFNNILTAILGHTEVLRRHTKTDEFAKRRIKIVEDAAKRAGQMVSKLLSFARKERLELVPTGLNAVVKDTAELLGRALIERNIAAQVLLDPDDPVINGDSIHLEQVIANLVMNAMDAMTGRGTITISTSRCELGPDSPHEYPFLPPGSYAVLTVRDTGSGIPREIMDKIFDPFFTTKPEGKGTGLGLAMVYGIVKSHKGEIRVNSKEGKGTAFEIYIPALDQPALTAAGKPGEVELPPAEKGERVFIVDDEKDVLSCIKDILEAQGYKVFTADSPGYARELFRRISGDIDLVITDIVMPVMSGAELAKIFKKASPAVKVIGMSGFEGGAAIVKKARHIDCFLKKPFDGVSLLTCVRRVLNPDEKNTASGA
jgi:two-component system cell cycle sensor histidine kinase/response regulator CckA